MPGVGADLYHDTAVYELQRRTAAVYAFVNLIFRLRLVCLFALRVFVRVVLWQR